MRNGNGKPGPKPKIGESERAQVIAIITAGGSCNDAADIIGVGRDTLYRALRDNSQFKTGVDRATAKGKLRLINKVKKSRPWQAAAWMLERKFGEEFGKKVDVQHGGTIAHDVRPMMEKVLADPSSAAAARTLARRADVVGESANGNANGNGNGHH